MKIAVEVLEAVVEEAVVLAAEVEVEEVVIEIIEMVIRANANSSLNQRCTHKKKCPDVPKKCPESALLLLKRPESCPPSSENDTFFFAVKIKEFSLFKNSLVKTIFCLEKLPHK